MQHRPLPLPPLLLLALLTSSLLLLGQQVPKPRPALRAGEDVCWLGGVCGCVWVCGGGMRCVCVYNAGKPCHVSFPRAPLLSPLNQDKSIHIHIYISLLPPFLFPPDEIKIKNARTQEVDGGGRQIHQHVIAWLFRLG